MPAAAPFLVHDRVRWADVDLVGIARFSAFTRFVELAEQELMRAAGMPYTEVFDAPDVLMPRRALTFEYFAPVRLDEMLTLVTYVARMGETSLTLNVDMRAASGAMVATAAMTIVCVTAADFRKRPLPEEMRGRLAPFTLPAEAARAAGASGNDR